jgi:hypothetical protein
MAMTVCKECKAQISTKADTCPQCGAKQTRTSGCAIIAAIFFGLVFFSVAVRSCFGEPDTTPPSERSPQPQPALSQTPVKVDPEGARAQSTKTVDEIEGRLKENDQKLKKFYGTTEEVKQATADLIQLAVIKGLYSEGKAREDVKIRSRADSLIAKVSQQQRQIYASAMEEIFVKNGLDVRVTATGTKKDQLRLRYVLMSKPLVYKFQNEMNLDDRARDVGFKKIIFTDGYDETWTIDL